MAAPASAARLWPHYDLSAERAPAEFLFSRLLEDGDGDELRWLFARHGEAAARRWFVERASRALSSRSRAFWRLMFGLPDTAPTAAARELWPLA